MSALSRRELLAATTASALLLACRSDRRRRGARGVHDEPDPRAGDRRSRLGAARAGARRTRGGPQLPRGAPRARGPDGRCDRRRERGPVGDGLRQRPPRSGHATASGGGVLWGARRSSCDATRGSGGPEDLRGQARSPPSAWARRRTSRCASTCACTATRPRERGGDVTLHALDATTILAGFARGALDGAWLAEPWATRVVREAGAVRLVDERDLWPERRFPTAVLVARGDWARALPARADGLSAVTADEIGRAAQAPEATRTVVGDELARLLGKRLPDDLLAEAWGRVDFTQRSPDDRPRHDRGRRVHPRPRAQELQQDAPGLTLSPSPVAAWRRSVAAAPRG